MPPADRGRSTSVRGRIRSPHSSNGLQPIACGEAGLGAGTDGQIAVSLNPPLWRGA